MRIGGIASGMDTESIINDLMKAQRIPLDKVTQKKQYFEWQLNDYRSANRDLKDFSTKLFDNMILSNKFNQKNVSISAPDDVSIVSKGNTENFSGTINVTQLATNATMQGGEIVNREDFKVASGSEVTIKTPDGSSKTVTFNGDETIEAVVKKITAETGVRAFYDSTTGKIGMSAKVSGKGAGNGQIEIIDKTGNVAENLGLLSTSTNPPSPQQAGQDAEFTYNGLTTSRSTNTFEIDGLEITLKAANNKNITFNATTDTDKVFDNVKQFVDDYNKLIEDINKKVREPKYRSYQPLSSEQKKDMSDKEIELWEEKAMSGTLRNDPELSNLLSSMRNVLTGSVEIGGEKVNLSSIGITTSKNYLDNGKLVIDEKKLKEAISKNPADVHKLFSNENTTNPEQTGLAHKLRSAVDATQKIIQKSAGKIGDSNKAFTLGRTLDDMNKQIDRFEDRMQMVESRYWKQFTAMENAIQRANAQSASLMSSLGGA